MKTLGYFEDDLNRISDVKIDVLKLFLQCPYADCGKYYGSEGSLNLHIKIKHNGGNKTEREKIAVISTFHCV